MSDDEKRILIREKPREMGMGITSLMMSAGHLVQCAFVDTGLRVAVIAYGPDSEQVHVVCQDREELVRAVRIWLRTMESSPPVNATSN